jgi:hypothetical protein
MQSAARKTYASLDLCPWRAELDWCILKTDITEKDETREGERERERERER